MKRILSPRLIFSGFLAFAVYLAVAGGDHSIFEARQADTRLVARQAEIRSARHQIDSLRARIDSLQHSDDALERFARERYGFIRDGEYLYLISEPQPQSKSGLTPRN